jgi:sugar O-acyltransferase (sialic acid O-acetyltransferase NeuD family)
MPSVVIYGASRQGSVVLSILRACRIPVRGYLDDRESAAGGMQDGLPVLGGWEWIGKNPRDEIGYAIGIGNNEARAGLGKKLRGAGLNLINAVHPSAVVMDEARLSTGVLVCAGAVIVAGTRVEDDAVINTGSTIDHDSLVAAGAYVSPGVHTAGCVSIGVRAFVGVGAVIGPGVTIGGGSIVGAGSLVLRDVPEGVFAYGSPAKVVRRIEGPLDWRRILSGEESGRKP